MKKEKSEDTKGIVRSCNSKKDRQYNNGKTNNDLQNTAQKAQDWATQTLLKSGGELGCSGRVSSSCSDSDNLRIIKVTNQVISHE